MKIALQKYVRGVLRRVVTTTLWHRRALDHDSRELQVSTIQRMKQRYEISLESVAMAQNKNAEEKKMSESTHGRRFGEC
ncbi:hypothetical protein EVAR_81107_1 [Eumeta japonica]|uniref:Uncharacterized protein n=1 Tax=Eumeta variegata TaxID=151549 RepID=A0A4C1T6M6_EUMVA|nr:hypothetical protein EVAR_81107_1 [Eumeta japonica]